MTRILVVLCTVALALVGTAVALAAQPTIIDIDRPLESLGADPVVSEVCGFPVDLANEGQSRIITYADGTVKSHHHERFYWSANGKSITEHADFTFVFAPDETQTVHGVVFNLQVPGGGPVFKEAGTVVFGPDGILRLAGQHTVLDGTSDVEALCDYFAG